VTLLNHPVIDVKVKYGYGTVVPDKCVVTALVALRINVAMAFAVVSDKTVAAATVTILPLKNVVQIHILIISVDLIKVAAMAFAAMRAKNVVYIIYQVFSFIIAALPIKFVVKVLVVTLIPSSVAMAVADAALRTSAA
jgi:hypothetical protein